MSILIRSQQQYITVEELRRAYDIRLIQQLISDTGTPQECIQDDDAVITQAIKWASAEVEAATLRGQKYSLKDLFDLRQSDDWTLKSIVCALSMKNLFKRRAATMPPTIQTDVSDARLMLTKLSEGDSVFKEGGAIDAGVPNVVTLSITERRQARLVADSAFFPLRTLTPP